MHDKPITTAIYILLGLLMATWPIISRYWKPKINIQVREWPPAVIVPAGLICGSTLVWWRQRATISTTELIVCGLITVVYLYALLGRPGQWNQGAALKRLFIASLVALSAFLSFSTGVLNHPDILLTAWPHWGAYVGPSELMLSGARIFYDFPAQYGFGPTLLIASVCGGSCWLAAYYVAGFATFIFGLLVIYIVASIPTRSYVVSSVMVLAAFFASFFWAAFPPVLATPLMVPSVSGLRFLPPLLLVAVQLWLNARPGFQPYWKVAGHLCFSLGALWSPESLFCVAFVWFPYFCWRKCELVEREKVFQTLVLASSTLLGITVALVAAFSLIYHLKYGVFPSFTAYAAYAIYPPGPLPINPTGPVWFALASIGLGAFSCFRLLQERREADECRRHLLVTLLGYAVLSYCMGRSHDNNFLNIAPFYVLILANVFSSNIGELWRTFTAVLVVSLLAWSSVFGWYVWRSTISAKRVWEFRPKHFIQAFTYDNPATRQFMINRWGSPSDLTNPNDVYLLTQKIQEQSAEPISIIDNAFLLSAVPFPAWNAFHGAAVYYYLPDEWRKKFVVRTAVRLQQSGWVILFKQLPPFWLEDYKAAYDVTAEIDGGSYFAIHIRPKATE